MGSTKDRNGLDLTEAEDIKKRWQEYTEELYKKDLQDPHNHDGVITHLESDILECEVKWALESITMNKASGGDGIPVQLFQILKDEISRSLGAQYATGDQFPDVQGGVRKGRETREQIANIRWIIKKARGFQKKHLLLLY